MRILGVLPRLPPSHAIPCLAQHADISERGRLVISKTDSVAVSEQNRLADGQKRLPFASRHQNRDFLAIGIFGGVRQVPRLRFFFFRLMTKGNTPKSIHCMLGPTMA